MRYKIIVKINEITIGFFNGIIYLSYEVEIKGIKTDTRKCTCNGTDKGVNEFKYRRLQSIIKIQSPYPAIWISFRIAMKRFHNRSLGQDIIQPRQELSGSFD